MEKNQGNFGSGDDFLDTIPKAQPMKGNLNLLCERHCKDKKTSHRLAGSICKTHI